LSSDALSPQGDWIAFHTGSTGEPLDLSLNLMHLPDGDVTTVTPLLSPEYLADLATVAAHFVSEVERPMTASDLDGMVFRWCLEVFEWSPSGRYLAFAAQRDGPSSDLYILDTAGFEIRRMTNSMEPLCGINWAPDEHSLLVASIIPEATGMGPGAETLRHIALDDPNPFEAPDLEEGYWWVGLGWLSPSQFLLGTGSDGGGPSHLRVLDLPSASIHEVWPDLVESYIIDFDRQRLAFTSLPSGAHAAEAPEGLSDGLYISQGGDPAQLVSPEIFWRLATTGFARYPILGVRPDGVFAISLDGHAARLSSMTESKSSVSPDHSWLVLYGPEGLEFFRSPATPTIRIPGVAASEVLWRPDSSGLYFSTDSEVFLLELPSTQMQLLDQCAPGEEGCWLHSLAWIP
jgi:dipeptidyl aminopeptidase/acylaminoacyl peptidase